MSPNQPDPGLQAFHSAVQSLKLYRRADIESEKGESLIEDLYVDPLPNDHVLQTMIRPNTTFIIGRKGTGKSTVFLRGQKALLSDGRFLCTYIDIKTVYESAQQVDGNTLDAVQSTNHSLTRNQVERLLLLRSFLHAVVRGIRDDIDDQLKTSFKARFAEFWTGSRAELLQDLNEFLADVETTKFVNIEGLRKEAVKTAGGHERTLSDSASGELTLTKDPGIKLGATSAVSETESSSQGSEYSAVLLRMIDIRALINRLRDVLTPLKVKHLVVFVDDFSELPLSAMQTVVDVLLAPLNNWSEELIKFKIAAYPGRIYYGAIDKSKVDEISLDLHSLYGQSNVSDMEEKGIEFTKRLVEKRLQYYGVQVDAFIPLRGRQDYWRSLFFASLGNPRTLGYILFYIYESVLIYERRLTVRSIRDASRRYYEEKVESYFGIGRFLHETFGERSTIYSLKELLEALVSRARELRSYRGSSLFRELGGQPPTSHFHVAQGYDSLLSTLELNFFINRYYVMSDRDGRRVTVYCLNYGLCDKYSIEFGRPSGSRDYRLYYVERVFDYTPIVQHYIASNQEIRCLTCGSQFDHSKLDALKMFGMRCPSCAEGVCEVVNISRRYEPILRKVDENSLLPQTELGIIQTLGSQQSGMFAGEIAGELDVSPQLVGWRGKKLADRGLVERRFVKSRRELELTQLAKEVYLPDDGAAELQVGAK
jgi:hypothetical protein